ncbi:unnamed protein product [Tilletia controversa]|nr:unnamed protein product [Tilletia controversa]
MITDSSQTRASRTHHVGFHLPPHARQQGQRARGGQRTASDSNHDARSTGQPLRARRASPRQYDFPAHADTDSLRNEIDEFYSYVEAPQITENRINWEEWVALGPRQRGGGETGLGAGGFGLNGLVNPQGGGTGNGQDRAGADGGGSDPQDTEEPASALGLGLGFAASPLDGVRARSGETIGHGRNLQCAQGRSMEACLALLATLEVREPEARVRASRALLYLLQGTFADTESPDDQMHWIRKNAQTVRSVGGVGEIFNALKVAVWKHEWLGSLPDFIPAPFDADIYGDGEPQPLMTPQAKADYMDEINLELALHFAQLYILVETGRGDEEWGDELMSLEPPLPIFLLNLLASLREKNAKGFPVKKLLLLTWKSFLACFGGQADIQRCKKLAREVEGLAPVQEQQAKAIKTKSSPHDIKTFKEDVAVKYPSYMPPPKNPGDFPLEQIASAVAPIPQRRPFGLLDGGPSGSGTTFSGPGQGNEGGGAPGGGPNQPGTPAPTPPASPKPNKQKYQTDQTRPFIFPYSFSVQGPRMVPFAIDEASRLYRAHMHVSLEMWQMWRIREQCIFEETGVAAAPDGSRVSGLGGIHGLESAGAASRSGVEFGQGSTTAAGGASNLSGSLASLKLSRTGAAGVGPSPLSRLDAGGATAGSSSQGSRSPTATDAPAQSLFSSSNTAAADSAEGLKVDRGEPTLDRLQDLEACLSEEISRLESDHMQAALDNEQWTLTLSKLRQQRADARRLQRIDMLFRATLPNLHSAVIVLLKLLLAGVTAQNNTNSEHAQALAEGVPIEEAPPPTVEDLDIIRHREITTKAIGAILLLSMKWFKVSHVMKFHFLCQLLVDSNCLLLILKMFGLQEAANVVKMRNEADKYSFFNYCYSNGGRDERASLPEDAMARQRAAAAAATAAEARARGNAGAEEGNGGPNGRAPMGGRDSPGPNGPITVVDGEEVEIVSEYSWRNFFSIINFTRIIQKLTKRRVHRILLMTQYKSSAILKRMLKVQHPALHLYTLKVLKSQVPYCGRKWKQSNMKIITAIYLNCRPELRDEWLAGMDIDGGLEDSLPQEQALRALIKFYLNTRYGPLPPPGGAAAGGGQQGGANAAAAAAQAAQHRRSGSTSQFGSAGGAGLAAAHANGEGEGGGASSGSAGDGHSGGGGGGGGGHGNAPSGLSRSPSGPGFFESDIFPPLRKSSESSAGTMRYIPDDVVEGYLDNYEDVLGEVFGHSNMGGSSDDDEYGAGWTSGKWGLTQEGSEAAWARLGEILGTNDDDATTDSAASGTDEEGSKGEGGDDNRTWENLSPKEMRFLSNGGANDGGEGGLGVDDGSGSGNLLSAPGSPLANRRRRSSISSNGSGGRANSDSSPLRPVLDFETDKVGDGSAVDDEDGAEERDGTGKATGGAGKGGEGNKDEDDDVDDLEPLPTPMDGGIDEVAHVWGV